MAGRKPKGNTMTKEEIVSLTQRKRSSSKLYKAEVKQLNDDSISNSVRKAISVMSISESMGKINLSDTEKVKSLVGAYLETCVNESVIPSMSDIATILGHTRMNIYSYMKNHRTTETGIFLVQVHDTIANILADNALKGNVNNIVGIFLLKAMYGYSETDNTASDAMISDGDDTEMTMEQIKEKYKNLIDE